MLPSHFYFFLNLHNHYFVLEELGMHLLLSLLKQCFLQCFHSSFYCYYLLQNLQYTILFLLL